jgi:hypothetical protein
MPDTPDTPAARREEMTDDEQAALLQLIQCFEVYPAATGLSHLTALLIRDAAKGRRASPA